jgi:hypothetical protein
MTEFSDQLQISLQGVFLFEIQSLIGRSLFNSKPNLTANDKNFLNLGCSSTVVNGWVNADFYNLRKLLLLKSEQNLLRPNWFLDLRFPLNCDDNVWDGVFTEHTLEHLYPTQAFNLIKEIFRTMKHGAWLRVTVPDLNKYVRFYKAEEVDNEFSLRWKTGCEAVRSLTQDYYHHSLWDSELLSLSLEKAGFINIQEVSYMVGSDKKLLIDRDIRKWETLYMEAQKP